MQVLLASFDLFKEVGGGQTFYRNLILKNPQIRFTYLSNSEPLDTPRPENAEAVACPSRYVQLQLSTAALLEVPNWSHYSFGRARDVARAVSGRHFDVVDLPDYEQFGLFLRSAFDHHRVSVDRIVLGMHGRISTSQELNWFVQGRDSADLTQLENMQYQAVDVRYFYSEMYRDEWRDVDPVPAPVVDPLWFFDVPQMLPYEDRPGPPDLNFVGRSEKRKGPDIFINMAWWLPRSCVRSARLIGPLNYDPDGTSSETYLQQMIRNRRLTGVELARCMTPAELSQVYATKSVTIIPSVYDTLNFVALESLLSGCPTFIGSGAGVCRYLHESFPGLPFEVIDVVNWFQCIPRLRTILSDYEDYRRCLHDAILAQDLQPRGPHITDIYQTPPAGNEMLRARVSDWYERLASSRPITHAGYSHHAQCA